jgi:hypothetical protein
MGIKLSSGSFITQASKATGLEDFGGPSFKEGLNVLIDSLNHDIELAEGTAGYFQNLILQILKNRLEVIQLIKDHPEILEETIETPIFILGLPRSGTTILHTLMALDPTARYLRNFESVGPICPPEELIPDSIDPRIQACHESMEGIFAMAPVLRGINGINFMAQGTAECQNLMAHEFVHMGWSCGSSLFAHGNWVSECRMQPAYDWHRRLLQVLQWKLPNERWILKAPMHLFRLADLLEIYPDARIVFTHRNPVDAMISGISMVYHWTQFTTGQENLRAIADWYPGLWAKGLKRALNVMKDVNPDHVHHISHSSLSASPIQVVAEINDTFGMRFSRGHEKRMRTWLRDHPRTKFGEHDHAKSIRDKIDWVKVSEQFEFYNDRFEM